MSRTKLELHVGKLYETQTVSWLVFHSEHDTLAHFAHAATAANAATLAYWARELNARVVIPESTFLVLSISSDNQRIEVLFEDFMGWINIPEWTHIYLKRVSNVS